MTATRETLALALRSAPVARELAARHLPADYLSQVRDHVLPIAEALARAVAAAPRPLVIGINGSQGSGKTTLANFLSLLLEQAAGLRSVVMSIDDFYLTRDERLRLGETVHPLLVTRGVPGTHDVDLARGVLGAIAAGETGVRIPRFDKAIDDRMPEHAWTVLDEPVTFAVFEGWCVGCRAQPEAALAEPVNELEATEDRDGRWRRFVNEQLAGSYDALFSALDRLVMLRAPSFDRVFEWRLQQEDELIAARAASGGASHRTMSPDAVRRFIAHYERLTRYMLEDLPSRADAVVPVDEGHRMCGLAGPLVEGP